MADQNTAGGTPAGGDAAVALTAEAVERIAATVLNNTLTARLRTFEKQFHEKISESLTATVSKAIAESMPKPKEGKAGKSGKDGASEETEEASPALKGMQRQMAEQAQQLQKMTQERDAERTKARDIALRTKLSDELVKHGITDPVGARHASMLLIDGEKRVQFSEDSDDIVFRDTTGDLLDLTSGLKGWVKSDDGKRFLPASGARGSGDRPGQGARNPNGQQPQSEQQAMADFGTALIANFGGIPVG